VGRLRKKLNYANVMATVAVFLALAGGAWAISKNSVGPRQIRPDAVRSSELKTGAVKSRDVAAAAIGTDKLADNAATGAKVDEGTLGEVPRAALAGGPSLFARVTPNGDVIEENSRGVTDAMIEQIASGTYCVHDVPAFKSVQITPRVETLNGGWAAPQWVTDPAAIQSYCTNNGFANGQGVVFMIRLRKADGTFDGTVDPSGFEIWFGS
jgi:hypothetical protein